MAELEKPIKILESCLADWGHGATMVCSIMTRIREAVELLKEQKQRIEALTFDRDVLANEVSYHNCNTCKTPCDYRPQPGERKGANCIGWHGE